MDIESDIYTSRGDDSILEYKFEDKNRLLNVEPFIDEINNDDGGSSKYILDDIEFGSFGVLNPSVTKLILNDNQFDVKLRLSLWHSLLCNDYINLFSSIGAKDSKCIIHAESLIIHICCTTIKDGYPLLDFASGPQTLQFIYRIEKFLSSITQCGGSITLVFFDIFSKIFSSETTQSKEHESETSSIDDNTNPPEVTTTVPTAVEASSNSLPVNGKATPGDRGRSKGSEGSENVTSSGLPAADLREAKGEVNKEATTASGKTSSGEDDVSVFFDGYLLLRQILMAHLRFNGVNYLCFNDWFTDDNWVSYVNNNEPTCIILDDGSSFTYLYNYIYELLDHPSKFNKFNGDNYQLYNDYLLLQNKIDYFSNIMRSLILQSLYNNISVAYLYEIGKYSSDFKAFISFSSNANVNPQLLHEIKMKFLHDFYPQYNKYTPLDVTPTVSRTPLEVQSTVPNTTSSPLAVVASSNYLSLKSIATPGDRGEVSDVTSSGLPAADLREAKGK